MSKKFAVGDIHGCCKTFRKLLLEKIIIEKTDEIICVGDYIDRGPDSKGVVDLIMELRDEGYTITTLRGNHEDMLLSSLGSKEYFKMWLVNGGDTTLNSFNISSIERLPEDYIQFFKNTEYYAETPDYILVHAGLNFAAKNILF